MKQYFIKELNLHNINLNNIRTNNSFHIRETHSNIFLNDFGFYIIENDKIINCKINHKSSNIVNNFLKKYTLYCNEIAIEKIEKSNIPYINHLIKIKKIEIKLNKYSKNSIVIEFYNDSIYDLYFLSNENYNNVSFQEDISLFIKILI